MEYQKKPVNIEGYEMYQCDTEGVVYGKNGKPLKPNVNQKAVSGNINNKISGLLIQPHNKSNMAAYPNRHRKQT